MSRAQFAPANSQLVAAQYEAAPGAEIVRGLKESFASATPETVAAIITEASRFSNKHLAPFCDPSDSEGAQLIDGRVRTATGHKEAWAAFVDGGWGTLDLPEEHGGQDLPLALATAVQEQLDRGCVAFGMLPVPQRAAVKLLDAHGDEQIRNTWLPKLTSGEWGATICVSEPDAGSDVDRIRTIAVRSDDGKWSVTGEKVWISFGDHDLVPRIGHCLLARTAGAKGLSLFLVPSTVDDEGRVANKIKVRRLEHKLGLHGSPTCALGFEGAEALLVGAEGRGLQQMFVMITSMRLSVGTQGLGIAAGCADTALLYATERRQGGAANADPVAIIEHADVRRQLLSMIARVEMLRGIGFATANQVNIAQHHPDEALRDEAAALSSWLLPIYKTFGGETAFDVASDAIQVLGGAGYTREWPIEQALRDARVFTVYEGTTGIQAIDLVKRRLVRDDRRGLQLFLREARRDALLCEAEYRLGAERCFDLLEDAANRLCAMDRVTDAEAGATAFLQLAILAATAWIAVRHASLQGQDPVTERLAATARYWLDEAADRATVVHALSLKGSGRLTSIDKILSTMA
jgi:3-(methylthio)propanoyl-CoA dehydrogenase